MPETPSPDPAARQALLRTIRDGEFAATDVPAYLALFCVTAEHDGDIQDEVRGWNRRIHLALADGDVGAPAWVNIADGKFTSGTGAPDAAELTLRMTPNEAARILVGDKDAKASYLAGSLKVEGRAARRRPLPDAGGPGGRRARAMNDEPPSARPVPLARPHAAAGSPAAAGEGPAAPDPPRPHGGLPEAAGAALPALAGAVRAGPALHPGRRAAQPGVQLPVPAGHGQGRRRRTCGTSTATATSTYLQAGGPILLGNNYAPVRDKVIELLRECGPVTGLFHEYELKLAELINQPHAVGRELPHARQRDRGLHGGHPRGAHLHRQEQDHQGRRRLPRLERPAGVRPAHPGHRRDGGVRHPRRAACATPRSSTRTTDDPRTGLRALLEKNATPRGHGGGDRWSRSGPRAAPGRSTGDFNRRARAAVRRVRGAADLRRGGDRLPPGPGRRPGLLRRAARPDGVRQVRDRRLPGRRRAGRAARGDGHAWRPGWRRARPGPTWAARCRPTR